MKLIDNIGEAWRFASVRLAVLAGVIAAWAASDPAGFAELVQHLPPWARPLVGLAVFAAATGARVIKRDTPTNPDA
jgi:hypothetical protein